MKDTKIKCWLKEHKTELIVSGVSIITIAALFVGIENRAMLEDKIPQMKKILCNPSVEGNSKKFLENATNDIGGISKEGISRAAHEVKSHLRKLPEGCKASKEKMALAIEYGYTLLPNQTWVESYHTGGNAA